MIPRSLFILLLTLMPFLCQATNKKAEKRYDQKKPPSTMTQKKYEYIAQKILQDNRKKNAIRSTAITLTFIPLFILEYMAYLLPLPQKYEKQGTLIAAKFLLSQIVIVPSTVHLFSRLQKLLGIDKQIDFHDLNENEIRFARSFINL